jgi:hypothetical protein
VICRDNNWAGTPIHAVCTKCQHAVLLHPSTANPGLSACLACELSELRDTYVAHVSRETDVNGCGE